MLRALFISLSESRWLRRDGRTIRHRAAPVQPLCGWHPGRRCAARHANRQQAGLSVSVDNLGENVTNAEEARASAQLYHQMLDEIASRQLNANVSLKLTHMGLDVDEKLARDLVTGLVEKAAAIIRPISSAWIWKARPTPSVPSILCMNCTACPVMRARGRGDPVLHAARGS